MGPLRELPLERGHLLEIEMHVREIYSKIPRFYRYHTLKHTIAVVESAKLIVREDGLTEHDGLLAEAAAWFHDVGYLRSLADHESMSAFRSLLFLTRLGINGNDVELIEQSILVTKLGAKPQSLVQQVLCDADMAHLASDDFLLWSDRLRKEWGAIRGLIMTDREWIQNNINFMRTVQFHTTYGKTVMRPQMEANMRTLEGMLAG